MNLTKEYILSCYDKTKHGCYQDLVEVEST